MGLTREGLPKARTAGVLAEQVGDETVVYDLHSKEVHCLSPVAAAVFACADGETPVAQIAELASGQLSEVIGTDEVATALTALRERGLLEDPPLLVRNANEGLSRRDILQRTALMGAGAAAASLITTVTAPAASAAVTGSLQPPGGPCTQNKDCLSNHCCQNQRDCNKLKCVACDNACNFRIPADPTSGCPSFCDPLSTDPCCRCVEPDPSLNCKHT